MEKINKRFPRILFSLLLDIVLSTPAILHFIHTYYYYSYYNKLFDWITWPPPCLPGHNQRAFGGLIHIFIQVTNNQSWRTLKALPKPPKTTANYKNLLLAKSIFFFGPLAAPTDVPGNSLRLDEGLATSP